MKISISPGNKKMGFIPSVSLPPVKTCAPGCTCAKKCYAAKMCRIYPSVKNAYDRNLEILNANDIEYWWQVKQAAQAARFFRFHVSGDIPDAHYFHMMIELARMLPHTNFLAFTKQYNIINEFADQFGADAIPENLKILFSEWPGMEMFNPYNFPVAHVIFKNQEPRDEWKICGGNCQECACRAVGCWELKNGEHIAFYEH